jgi:NAD(P)-dependent dehydrogenase (short-subunit alcohol dehydrogenase family)
LDWDDKIAVITGAASGIGAGLARYALDLGMTVYAADLDGAKLQNLDSSSNLHCSGLDVTDAGQLEALATKVFARHGQVNLLFNNAGVLVDGKSWERSDEDWHWIFEVNVMGVVNGIRAFVPRMLEQGASGRIINTSSIGGLLGGGPYLAPYQGTKHFITALTESLYRELQLEDAPVTASVLCPGEVSSAIWSSERNRPRDQRNKLNSEAEKEFRATQAANVSAGMAPEEFARKVFKGIAEDKFWLLPQPEFKDVLRQRADSIINETPPPDLNLGGAD